MSASTFFCDSWVNPTLNKEFPKWCEWLREVPGNSWQAKCEVCGKIIELSNMGFLRQAVQPLGNSIEKYIQKLDQDVRRTGRVTRKEIDDVLQELKQTKNVSGVQSLMLIRCYGNILPEESPEVRTKLVKQLWKDLERYGIPLDISHYNALLRVYIENEHSFSPSEFLSDLENKGIEPNRVTFQRLITAYCQRGDIEGATSILEFMKDKQMPVNESVFSSLINGHFQSDDIKSAIGMLKVMKQANITPTSETYTTIMCGYAKSGDINGINEVLADCAKEDIDISDKDILEVVYSLAINNHSDLIDQMLEKLKKLPGYNQDAKSIILRLIVQGRDEAAIKILYSMSEILVSEGPPAQIGNFLIRQMVKCNRPLEKIVSFCEKLEKSKANEYALSIATEASLLIPNPLRSLKLLTALSQNHEVCQHYYWPILVQYGRSGDSEGVRKTLLQMVQEVGQPVNGETLRDFVVPFLPPNEQGIYEARGAGIPIATVAAAFVGHLLLKNDISSAAKIALDFRANYSSVQICKSAVQAYVSTNDLSSFISLARSIVGSGTDDAEKVNFNAADRIILDVVHGLRRAGKLGQFPEVLQGFLDSGIGITSEAAEEIQSLLNGEQLTTEISTLLSKLTSPDLTLSVIERTQVGTRAPNSYFNKESDILRGIEISKSKGESPLGLYRQLLSFYCVNKDLEKAEKLYKELEETGFGFAIGTLIYLMELYIHYDNLPKALEFYNKIFSSQEPPVEIDPTKILKLGSLMIKLDKIDDAFALLSKHKPESVDSVKSFNANTLNWRLLNSIAEKKDPELLQKVFNGLVEYNFMEANNITLGPLIKVHFLRDDIDAAMVQFEECCVKYRATPWKNEIACKLIQKEDPISLQKLTDLSTSIHGEINSLYDLVLSFIECGRIRQARKILETPGLRLKNQRINSACERYNNEGKVNYLENLVEATKDLNHIDRSDIYYHLLLSYDKNDEVDKAFGLWTQMQDEDVQPSESFLFRLSQILQRHDRPVPFAAPEVEEKPEQSKFKSRESTDDVKTFRKTMNSRNVDEALERLSRINDNSLTKGDRSKMLTLLTDNGRIGEALKLVTAWLKAGSTFNVKALDIFVNTLAKNGEINSLSAVGDLLDERLKKFTSFVNRYAHCMVEAGKVDELLSNLENGIMSAKTEKEIESLREEFPKGGIFCVLDNVPETIPRVEKLSELYREKGISEPSCALWSFYFAKGNFEKAKEFWEHTDKSGRIMFQPILKQIRKTGDVALCWDLLNFLKASEVDSFQLAPLYTLLIDLENISGNLPECERILEEAIKDCKLENLARPPILRLKIKLEESGKAFPYQLPPKGFRRPMEDTSTSSDSDSDSESARKPRVQL